MVGLETGLMGCTKQAQNTRERGRRQGAGAVLIQMREGKSRASCYPFFVFEKAVARFCCLPGHAAACWPWVGFGCQSLLRHGAVQCKAGIRHLLACGACRHAAPASTAGRG